MGIIINCPPLSTLFPYTTLFRSVNLVIVRASGGGFYPYVELRAPDGTYLAGADNTSGVEYLGLNGKSTRLNYSHTGIAYADDRLKERYDYTLSLTKFPATNAVPI